MYNFIFRNATAVMCKFLLLFLSLIAVMSCQPTRQSSKYGLVEGRYSGHGNGQNVVPVYVFPDDDSIKLYSSLLANNGRADSAQSLLMAFPAIYHNGPKKYSFSQHTLDLDVLSILLKYRPAVQGFPNQLNTSILNGAVFFGYRTDRYNLSYQESAFGVEKRSVNHTGLSFGVFSGIGASRIDPFVTRGALAIEYDGLVNPSGIATIIAVDKLTFGLTFGVDHLLDKNHGVWIYQGKPWMGLSVGLNLN
jgi:hypothetical protein